MYTFVSISCEALQVAKSIISFLYYYHYNVCVCVCVHACACVCDCKELLVLAASKGFFSFFLFFGWQLHTFEHSTVRKACYEKKARNRTLQFCTMCSFFPGGKVNSRVCWNALITILGKMMTMNIVIVFQMFLLHTLRCLWVSIDRLMDFTG